MTDRPAPGQCRSCSAPIWWATTEAGSSSPVDADPHPEGTVVLRLILGHLHSRIVPVGQALQPGEQRRRPHWATCPQATAHRRPAPWRPCGYPGCSQGYCDDCDGKGWQPRRGGK